MSNQVPHPQPPLPAMSLDAIPTLPADVQLSYLAEGAANIVYRMTFFPRSRTPLPTSIDPPAQQQQQSTSNTANATPPPTELEPPSATTAEDDYDPSEDPMYDNVLLRLRKALPSAQPNIDAHKYLSEVVMPLFPTDLPLIQTPIKLPPNLIPTANAALRRLEAGGSRPEKRCGLYLAGDETAAPGSGESDHEDLGFLVTDMTPEKLKGEVMIEFKPKWLQQSPSAPPNWKRCRTCALRLFKYSKSGIWEGLCPMDLTATDDEARVRRAAGWIVRNCKWIMKDVHGHDLERLMERVGDYLLSEKGQFVLGTLKELQGKLDPKGPLEADVGSTEFLTAMTVRDSTVFLRVTPDEIQARLGDLDKKIPGEGKQEYWKGVENDLITGGWYTGEEKGDDYPWKQQGKDVSCR